MFVRRLPYIIYRSYSDCGYLTDNRNFGYDTASHSCLKVGDLLLSKGGSLFYSMLNESPQKVEDIVKKLSHTFKNIPISTLYNDALNFYLELSKQGFIICCENKTDCNNVPTYFSYDRVLPTELSIVNENSLEAKFWLSQQSCRLTRVHIDISSRCNENCVHCYIPSRNKCSVMPESVFDRVIE